MNTNNQIDDFINSFGDWRSRRLQELHELINGVGPELKEEYKWSVPVWSGKRLLCAISGHKEFVKINFFQGRLPTGSKPFQLRFGFKRTPIY